MIMQFPNVSELWVRYVSRLYHLSFAWLFSLIPISLLELVFVSWLAFLIGFCLVTIRKLFQRQIHHAAKAFAKAMTLFLVMTNLYVATAGIAYARLPVPLPQYQQTVAVESYRPMVEHYRNQFNEVASNLTFEENGSVINPYTIEELNHFIHLAYDQANLDHTYFTSYSTRIKPLLTSFLYREFHITGVHFAPTTEATINVLVPDALIPFTMAHELAHAKGVMREEDANLVALYVCLSSNDPYLQYSALFNSFYALLNLLRYIGVPSAYGEVYQSLALTIRKDYAYQNTYWDQYTLLDDVARWINDTYLRIFGNDGVDSYVDVPEVEVIDNGENTIEVIRQFSPYQKLFFSLYFTSNAS
ncbi:MAG: DUF3810 family protein [Bacilli bacterium]